MHNWLVEHQQFFSQQIRQQRLPHAIVVAGHAGVGKHLLVQWLTAALTCQQPSNQDNVIDACGGCKSCLLRLANTHPDHSTILTDANTIGVDDIRRVSRFFQTTAQMSRFKTVVIQSADKMTVAASNALLKTLEEPPASSFIFLTTNDVDALLPTIISRCTVITIRPPVGGKLLSSLGQEVQDPFANISQLAELTDPEQYRQQHVFIEQLLLYIDKGRNHKALVQQMLDNEHCLRWLEKFVVNLMRSQQSWPVQQSNSGDHNLQILLSIEQQSLTEIYQLIIAATTQLKDFVQANKQFVFEKLLLDITAKVSASFVPEDLAR